MKPLDRKYQTTTQVNVLSPVISNVKEADSVHLLEGRMIYFDMARDKSLFRGLRQWYDTEWRLQELGRPELFPKDWISADNLKRREGGEDSLGVGLIHSRGVAGVMFCEAASHSKGLALICTGEGTHSPATELEELWKRN